MNDEAAVEPVVSSGASWEDTAKAAAWIWVFQFVKDAARIGIPVSAWVAWQRTHDVVTTICAGFTSWGYVAYLHWWTR